MTNKIMLSPSVLCRMNNTYAPSQEKNNILFVADSQRPLALCNSYGKWETIKNNKVNYSFFYNSLSKEKKENFLLRAYPSGTGAFDCRYWDLFKQVQCANGDMYEIMHSSRVIVLDYIASTFGLAMVLNMPVLWIRKSYMSTFLHDTLLECGIIHTSHAAAALFLNQNYEKIYEWWYSAKVQAAREIYLKTDLDVFNKNYLLETFNTMYRINSVFSSKNTKV